jgi:predicted molibdopterin-dependent oxidoreductase YjgC
MSPARLSKPLVRKNGKLTEAAWPEALDAAAGGLEEIRRRHGAQALAVLGSSASTNEAGFLLMRFARQVLGTNNVDFTGRMDWAGAHGAYPASAIEDIDEADLIILIEADSGSEHPAVTARLWRAKQRGAKLLAIGQRRHRLARLADLHLQPLPGRHAEIVVGIIAGVFTSTALSSLPESVVKSLAPIFLRMADYTPDKAAKAVGVPEEQIRQVAEAFAKAEKPLILLGKGPLRSRRARDFVSAVGNLLALGRAMGKKPPGRDNAGGWLALGAEANSRGAHEMGLDPGLLSGYQPVTDSMARRAFENAWGAPLPEKRGLSLLEMKDLVRGMFIMGDDPVYSCADPARMRETLNNLEFLVIQDSFKGRLLEKADVVLPAAAFGEEDGTSTNLGGRLQRVRAASSPPAEARPNWEIICELARQMGTDFGLKSPEEIMQHIAGLTPLYERVSYQSLEEAFGRLLPMHILLQAAPASPPPLQVEVEPPPHDHAFPLWLGVDFTASSWEGDPIVMSCPIMRQEFSILTKDFPNGYVEISPADAGKLGLRNGSRVKVTGRKGEFSTSIQISEEVPAGVVLLPFWQRERAFPALEKVAEDGGASIEPVQVKIEGA